MSDRLIKKESLISSFLQQRKEILLSYPPHAGQSSQLPVLLLYDGPDYFYLGRLITLANQLIASGELRPFLSVALPVNKQKRAAEYSPQGRLHAAYQRFLTKEVFPLLKEKHPVSPDVQDWVIGGVSLGGTAALHFALKHPALCSSVICQSGAFLPQTLEAISQQPSLSSLSIYQSVGQGETAVKTHRGKADLLTRNRQVRQLLAEKQAHVQYAEREGEHTWGLWQRDLPDALKMFFATSVD